MKHSRSGIRKRFFHQRSKKAGLPPGTLVHEGERKTGDVRISLFEYSSDTLQEHTSESIDEVLKLDRRGGTRWINIDGLHRIDALERLGHHYHIHPLVLEDIVHTAQRPKLEEYNGQIFIVLRMLSFDPASAEVQSEQVSLIFGEDFLLSFQEAPGDVFDPIRLRIRTQKGHMRSQGPDFLAYSLIDAVVDQYFVILEALGDRLEDVENDLLQTPSQDTLHEIYRLKREVMLVRKATWPLREVIGQLMRADEKLIRKSTQLYLRDLYDHIIAVLDSLENQRELLASMLEMYLSSVSNRMNEVMKVLTVIATIFIPLTFIAGLYGMNFSSSASPWNMPELQWYWGYPAVLFLMGLVALALMMFFKKKGWL